jgi:hypothetical protein
MTRLDETKAKLTGKRWMRDAEDGSGEIAQCRCHVDDMMGSWGRGRRHGAWGTRIASMSSWIRTSCVANQSITQLLPWSPWISLSLLLIIIQRDSRVWENPTTWEIPTGNSRAHDPCERSERESSHAHALDSRKPCERSERQVHGPAQSVRHASRRFFNTYIIQQLNVNNN